MSKSKIDFNNITNLNYSNISNMNQINNPNNEIYNNEIYNQNILIYRDDDYETMKKETKKNNKSEFEKVMKQTIKNFISLSQKTKEIINTKTFCLKLFIKKNSNIQSLESDEKNDNKSNTSLNNSLSNNININDSINGNNELVNNNSNGKNHFMVYEAPNNNFTSSIFKQNSLENNQQILIGKKRKIEKNNKNEKIEKEKKIIFNDILFICNEISNFNNNIIKREEQSNFINDNENIETTLIINNNAIATIYLNGDTVNKIYIFKNDKLFIKENEILSQLKQIRKNMNVILNKLKKNNI